MKYYLSICAIFKNEAAYLGEWIEFHRLAGVEHFYLYNNLSDDNYFSVLKYYIDKGTVTLRDWPEEWKRYAQSNVYPVPGFTSHLFPVRRIDRRGNLVNDYQ